MYIFGGDDNNSKNDLHRTDLSAVTSELNGRPVLRFDGSDDYFNLIDTGLPSGGNPRTAIVVGKSRSSTIRGDFFSYRDNDNTGHTWGLSFNMYASNAIDVSYWAGGSSAGGLVITNPMIITTMLTSSSSVSTSIWKNGAALSLTQGPNITVATGTGTGKGAIGGSIDYIGISRMTGDIAAVIIYNRALAEHERCQVEHYLSQRYGIAVSSSIPQPLALFLDASMGVTTVDGKCSQWSDQSGNARHASQSTAGYRPEFVADPQTNQWSGALSPSGTPPTARGGHTSVIYGDYMYVFGGHDGTLKNDLHRLDLTTLTWSGTLSPSGTPPTARYNHTSVIYGNYMYVFGGFSGSRKNDLHRLDLTTLTWSGALSPSGTPPIARYHHTSVIYDNYMYFFGGTDGSGENDLRTDLSAVTSELNGRPVLRFDGSNDYLNLGDIMDDIWCAEDGRYSIFAVVNATNAGSSRTILGKMGDSTHSEDQRQNFLGIATDTTVKLRYTEVYSVNGSNFRLYGVPFSLSTNTVVSFVFDGSLDTNDGSDRFLFHTNGSLGVRNQWVSTGNLGTQVNSAARLSIGACIGASSALVSYPWYGDIAAIIVYNRALSDAERQRVERWLATRYGITLA